MAHTQKSDFVFRRNGRVHLNRRGHQFSRLLAAEVCASAVVMLDTPCSEVVYRVLATHSLRQFPLHFPFRASPCAITFQLESTGNAVATLCTSLQHLRSIGYWQPIRMWTSWKVEKVDRLRGAEVANVSTYSCINLQVGVQPCLHLYILYASLSNISKVSLAVTHCSITCLTNLALRQKSHWIWIFVFIETDCILFNHNTV
jgi:hypothetical protein